MGNDDLRDVIAALAMQGLISAGSLKEFEDPLKDTEKMTQEAYMQKIAEQAYMLGFAMKDIANKAYMQADAMLKERNNKWGER